MLEGAKREDDRPLLHQEPLFGSVAGAGGTVRHVLGFVPHLFCRVMIKYATPLTEIPQSAKFASIGVNPERVAAMRGGAKLILLLVSPIRGAQLKRKGMRGH